MVTDFVTVKVAGEVPAASARRIAKGVSLIGRVTQGVKLMDLEAEERVVSLAKVAEKSDDGEPEPEADLGLS